MFEHMTGDGPPEVPGIMQAFGAGRRAAPQTPRELLQRSPGLAKRLEKWDPVAALAKLAGLQLEPRFHANFIRLTWALRLVLGLAKGDVRPKRRDLTKLLNIDLAKADIVDQEDPPEDFFLAPIPTRKGDIPIFQGVWGHSAFYAETLVEAFERVADGQDNELLLSIDALLAVSRKVAKRQGLDRRVAGSGRRAAPMNLPFDLNLARLAQSVIWSGEQLEQADIAAAALEPFILTPADCLAALETTIGNSPLDFKPFYQVGNGLLLVSPSAISLAARAAIVDHILATGRDDKLADALLKVQAERLSETRFVVTDNLPIRREKEGPVLTDLLEISAGRFVQIEQTVGDFADWRTLGLGDFRPPDPAHSARIIAGMRAAREAARQNGDFRYGTTLYLMGGWGKGGYLNVKIPDDITDWGLLVLEVADVIALANCEGGTIPDVWRIAGLESLVKGAGFSLENMSGMLNLFQWWRETDCCLVPQRDKQMRPPLGLLIPTDMLFKVRQEGHGAHDRRAVAFPGGQFVPVFRHEAFANFGELQPIYVSYGALRNRLLLGVVLSTGRPGWIGLLQPSDEAEVTVAYQTWSTALQWLALVMPLLDDRDADLADDPVVITIELGHQPEWEENAPDDTMLDRDIAVVSDGERGRVRISLGDQWHLGARRVDNRAEIALGAALLEGAALAAGRRMDRAEALERVQAAIRSPDVRWRHAYFPDRAGDLLRLHGLLSQECIPLSLSAGALVKFGRAFSEKRCAGTRIVGRDACMAALLELHAQSLDRLLDYIAQFDRLQLVEMAVGIQQAALAEDLHWALTARALRSIHGESVDRVASLDHRHRINGALRASGMIAEIAAVHSPEAGGVRAGRMDQEELSALALSHFNDCELIAGMAGGYLEARLTVSPTGDLLYDHGFEAQALVPSVVTLNHENRERDVADYGRRVGRPEGTPSGLPLDLQHAVRSEYGVDADELGDLSSALCQLAIEEGRDVLTMPRSALIARLQAIGFNKGEPVEPLIDRLILPSRNGWRDLPEGADSNDFDLGRFDRRWSLIARPLLAIDGADDPLLVVGPAVVERCVMHNLSGAFEGGLQNRFWSSPDMLSYTGSAGDRGGMAFNDLVAGELTQLGLDATPSMKPWACLNHQATPAIKALGDIDVFVISQDRCHVWVIEAKDIKLCRTLGETARRLSSYRGLTGRKGKPDNLLKHLNRVAYIREHVADLAKCLKLQTVPQVHGLVVVNTPQPMVFFQINPSPDATFVRLADVATIHWQPQRKWTPKRRTKGDR